MTSPRRAAAGGDRRRRAAHFRGVLVVALALVVPMLPGRAEEPDPFTATVKIDATADTAVKAREAARLDGQRRALAAVADHLSGVAAPGTNSAKLAKIDDRAITDLVASFEVANERMSAVRYIADYTFHFRPEEAKRALRGAGVALGGEPAKEAGKAVVLLPVYQSGGQVRLWDDPNPWRDAWARRPAGSAATRLAVPLGDAGDVAAIDADKALAGDAAALTAIARRNGGEEVIVLLAATRAPDDKPAGLDVAAKHYRAGHLVDSHAEPIAGNPGEGESELVGRAVTTVAADIESGWKKEPVAGYDQVGTLTAVLPISGLDDWVRARERLAGVPAIRKIALVALSRQEATIEIGYGGSIDQLKASLAGISFDLIRGESTWRLARTAPDRQP